MLFIKKIDWYILKKFITTFLFTLLLLTVITVVIDISEKSDDFVKSGLGAFDIMTKYYFGFIPRMLALLFPLFIFISVIFFTSKMAGRSEVIAILASGTSFNRFLRPYVYGGIFFAIILWFGQRYLVPKANIIYSEFQTKYVDVNSSYVQQQKARILQSRYRRIDSTTYGGILSYDTTAKQSYTFFLHKIKNNEIVYNLRAEGIRWDTAGKKNKWALTNVMEHTFDSLNETVKLTPLIDTLFNFKPDDLSADEYTKDKMSTPALNKFIVGEKQRGNETNELEVESYRRDATPFAVLLLALMGAIVGSRKVRGGSGAHLAIGFVTAALFILLDRFSTIFSTKGDFPPLLAAWTPNIVFILVTIYLYKRAPK